MKTKIILSTFCALLFFTANAQNTKQQIRALQLNVDTVGNIKIKPINYDKIQNYASVNLANEKKISSQGITKTKKDASFIKQESYWANSVNKIQNCITADNNKNTALVTENNIQNSSLNTSDGNDSAFLDFDENNAKLQKSGAENTTNFQTINDSKGSPNLYIYTGVGANNTYYYSSTTQILDLYASVLNGGTSTAVWFRLGFYLSTDITFQTTDVFLSSYYFLSLSAGFYANAQLSIDLDNISLASGTYYIFMVCDDNNFVIESNENDNIRYFTDPITYTAPSTVNIYPYTGEGANNSYIYDDATKLLNLNASVVNGGNSMANSFVVSFCLSANETLDTTDIVENLDTVPFLESGYYTNISTLVDLNNFELASGAYYIFIICDIANQLDETNETDNVDHFINPILYTEPNKINLFVYMGEGSNNSYEFDNISHELQLAASIGNMGNTEANNFRVGFYISNDITLDVSDKIITSETVSNLPYGLYHNISTSANLDDLELAEGDYYIMIYCDDLLEITETDETDNGNYFTQSITYTPAELVNICVYNGRDAHNDYSFNTATHELQVTTSIENDGNATAKNFRIGLYLSTDATIKSTDTFLDGATISALENGNNKKIEFMIDLDNFSITSGNYFLGIYCDDLNKIDETLETDNGYTFKNNNIQFNATAVSENLQPTDFLIYPNPTDGFITLVPNKFINDQSSVTILGYNGMVFDEYVLPTISSETNVTINLSTYKRGIYFIKIANSNFSEVKKVVKL